MMFGVADLSCAAGCAAGSAQRLPKVRYGCYFSGMVVEGECWEDDEAKVRRRMKRAEERRRKGTEVEGRGRRLIGKLIKMLTVKADHLLSVSSRKTFPSRETKNARKQQQQQQQQQQKSPNSSHSTIFEPMPTIVEETEGELIFEAVEELIDGEEQWRRRKGGDEEEERAAGGGGGTAAVDEWEEEESEKARE